MSPKKDETAVHCWNPAVSVIVVLESRNFFYVASALQSIAYQQHANPVVCNQRINWIAFVALEVIRNCTQWIFTHNYTIYDIIVLDRPSFKEDDDKNYNRVYLASAHMDNDTKHLLACFFSLLKLAKPDQSIFWNMKSKLE